MALRIPAGTDRHVHDLQCSLVVAIFIISVRSGDFLYYYYSPLQCDVVYVDGDYVSELRPATGLLFIPQVIYEYGKPRWNDTDRGNPKKPEKKLSHCHCHHISHMQ
jgi:hypothetical protein